MLSLPKFNRTRLALSLLAAVASSVVVARCVWNDRHGDSQPEIQSVSAILSRLELHERGRNSPTKGMPEFTEEDFGALPPIWEELDQSAKHLTAHNCATARAKALVMLEKKPDAILVDEWRARFEVAGQRFAVYGSPSQRAAKSVGFCIAAFVLSLPVAWAFLLVMSKMWYFALDRVREFFRAIRGESQ